MKNYDELNDVEKHILREYREWVKCEIVALALTEAMYWRQRARALNIEHLL